MHLQECYKSFYKVSFYERKLLSGKGSQDTFFSECNSIRSFLKKYIKKYNISD